MHLLFRTFGAVFASQRIPATQAHNHVGKNATVCGNAASNHYAATSRGRPTFINLDKAHPNQVFTVVIWGSDRAKFGSHEAEYQGKDICLTGKIAEYRGTPEIVAASPGPIKTRQKHKEWSGSLMTRHEKESFESKHVVLDEGVFIDCTFDNCSLEYSGGDTYVQDCRGENCQLVWRDAAQRTVALLQGLGLIAQSPVTVIKTSTNLVQ